MRKRSVGYGWVRMGVDAGKGKVEARFDRTGGTGGTGEITRFCTSLKWTRISTDKRYEVFIECRQDKKVQLD